MENFSANNSLIQVARAYTRLHNVSCAGHMVDIQ